MRLRTKKACVAAKYVIALRIDLRATYNQDARPHHAVSTASATVGWEITFGQLYCTSHSMLELNLPSLSSSIRA